MDSSGNWVDGPCALFETPSAPRNIAKMAFAHNVMLRSLNAIYLQPPHIPDADIADVLFFVSSYCAWLLHHNDIEEEAMFPAFEAVPGVKPLQYNLDQYRIFSDGLVTLKKNAEDTIPSRCTGEKVCAIIDGFSHALHTHLRLRSVYEQCEKEAGKRDKNVAPPTVLGLCDKPFQGGNDWPKIPMGSAGIDYYLFGRKHSNPRQLKFIGNE
ncbi:hypothetical protein BCR34DRAFT_629559 [Clohesyomyces aquaticus]|uniref:Hemerythrin-like domain-containing protein n=1 Tax=Clohesyomyces aquaticus TaxID=1231657 RepID=A0A1Y1Y159_9PLEO|nr:hypothetical protein BCR34DRAFT_629559 [Clohesyomyces aquaticus]